MDVMAQVVSYWMQGYPDGGPLLLYRLTSDDQGMVTEAFDPRTGWVDDPGDFVRMPESRVVTPVDAEKAAEYLRARLPVREAAEHKPSGTPEVATPESGPSTPRQETSAPGDVKASEIVARGDLLDIPFESPDPAGPIQYGGDAPADPQETAADDEQQLAWANNFIFGTPMPEQGGQDGQVHPVSKRPNSGASGERARVRPAGGGGAAGGPAQPPKPVG